MPADDLPIFHLGASTRRQFIVDGASVVAATAVAKQLSGGRRIVAPRRLPEMRQSMGSQLEALRALGRSSMRQPGSLPNPALAAGTDTLPEIEHVVVLMMENHSYDNFFGMLGRGIGQQPRGDGFTIASDGYPSATNPYSNGKLQRAFRMPTTCQLDGHPGQEWTTSHISYADGRLDGFVISPSGPVSMGYWQQQDLPFTYDLATNFPIGDRWFCSVLGQTDPNRRYLIAATSSGMTDDVGKSGADSTLLVAPPSGTIFTRLTDARISWTDYADAYPSVIGETPELYPTPDAVLLSTNARPIARFYTDAAAGKLPSFTLLDPNYDTQSQENPQNIVVGESFLARVVNALGSSPKWLQTLLIVTYDEHGGYFEHVPPPVALAPDSIGPVVQPGESTYDGFTRYGFRVPSIVVGPYAKTNYVSHMVYDHTSILAFVERKWNLPALTRRDANANDLTDFLDLDAMAKGEPTFPELPKLAAAGANSATLACSMSGPGTIPPPPPAPMPLRLQLRYTRPSRKHRGIVIELQANQWYFTDLTVELHHGRKVLAKVRVARVSTVPHKLVLGDHGKLPTAGRYTITVRQGHKTLVKRKVDIR